METIEHSLAALARKEIELHDEWDSLHHLLVVYRDGDKARIGTFAAIDPAFDPDLYPLVIRGITAESAAKEGPPYALLLQIEAFGAVLPEEGIADPAERAQFEEDRRNRNLHKRADAVEAAWAWAVDVHGQTWSARKTRGKEDTIEERFYPAGSKEIGGVMQQAMHDVLGVFGSGG